MGTQIFFELVEFRVANFWVNNSFRSHTSLLVFTFLGIAVLAPDQRSPQRRDDHLHESRGFSVVRAFKVIS
jgi:hypothetical protein